MTYDKGDKFPAKGWPPQDLAQITLHTPRFHLSTKNGQSSLDLKNLILKTASGIPIVAQRKRIRLGTMRLGVRPLTSLSGLRIQCGCELWCRSQMQFGSGVAVAVA